MAHAPMQREPYERVISTTFAILSLVLGVLPLIYFLVNLALRIRYHASGMPSLLILFLPAGLIGLSATIVGYLRRGDVLHWLHPGPLNYMFLLLMFLLSALTLAETRVIGLLIIGWMGLQPSVANALSLLPVIAAGLVFAFYWRRASDKRVQE
jgi:hypothetical protein